LLFLRLSFPGRLRHPKNAWLVGRCCVGLSGDDAGWLAGGMGARLGTIRKTQDGDVIDNSSGGIADIAPILGKDISRKSHAANMWR
jgi:hypothetical protein